MIWIAVDPGRRIGWALCGGGAIIDCGTCSGLHELPAASLCIVEIPRVYPNPGKWRGNPQDIVLLAFLAGRIAQRYPAHEKLEPREWRGMAKEDVVWRRTWSKLTAAEQWALPERHSEHCRDALGIAVFVMGR